MQRNMETGGTQRLKLIKIHLKRIEARKKWFQVNLKSIQIRFFEILSWSKSISNISISALLFFHSKIDIKLIYLLFYTKTDPNRFLSA